MADLQSQIGLIAGAGWALNIGATCGIIGEKKYGWALIRAWALNRDNTVRVYSILSVCVFEYLCSEGFDK